MVKNPKTPILLVLSASLVTGAMLMGGCITKEAEDITPQEAYTLIQENQDSPDFVIIDVRAPGEFAEGHIANAININYYSEAFHAELEQLDKNKTYLIYCRSGNRSGKALNIMEELNFREVYNMLGGITQWEAEGFLATK